MLKMGGITILIFPVAPWIVEVNYYAAYSSILFSMIAGLLLGDLKADPGLRIAGWFFLVYLFATSLTNFVETAKRHPAFDKTDLTWTVLEEAKRKVREDGFAKTALTYPFPSRMFDWIFEYEAHRLHARGLQVDLVPMGRPSDTHYGNIDIARIADPRLVLARPEIPKNEGELLKYGAMLLEDEALKQKLFLGGSMVGATGPWQYERSIDAEGRVTARIWYTGLMRLWERKGRLVLESGKVCLVFEKFYRECWSRLYRLGDTYYAVRSDRSVVTFFKWRQSP